MLASHIRVGVGGVARLQGESPTTTTKTPWCLPSLHTRLAVKQCTKIETRWPFVYIIENSRKTDRTDFCHGTLFIPRRIQFTTFWPISPFVTSQTSSVHDYDETQILQVKWNSLRTLYTENMGAYWCTYRITASHNCSPPPPKGEPLWLWITPKNDGPKGLRALDLPCIFGPRFPCLFGSGYVWPNSANAQRTFPLRRQKLVLNSDGSHKHICLRIITY